ncbi:vegetative cell wall protein gp1-like [Brachypodium distachyon]|uniref:vegetative cell wall protein gp1-like n=1 Tax=Brachypodium distachyon TaxID=15368 RepID=UPI000D0DD380|nr:vegetative cell wall protein gp1-like [Brachypodium distachyon]|eukprot:XP_024311493.1 vegetative cell wall protein gp1-like [Brachypodium distachyon]
MIVRLNVFRWLCETTLHEEPSMKLLLFYFTVEVRELLTLDSFALRAFGSMNLRLRSGFGDDFLVMPGKSTEKLFVKWESQCDFFRGEGGIVGHAADRSLISSFFSFSFFPGRRRSSSPLLLPPARPLLCSLSRAPRRSPSRRRRLPSAPRAPRAPSSSRPLSLSTRTPAPPGSLSSRAALAPRAARALPARASTSSAPPSAPPSTAPDARVARVRPRRAPPRPPRTPLLLPPPAPPLPWPRAPPPLLRLSAPRSPARLLPLRLSLPRRRSLLRPLPAPSSLPSSLARAAPRALLSPELPACAAPFLLCSARACISPRRRLLPLAAPPKPDRLLSLPKTRPRPISKPRKQSVCCCLLPLLRVEPPWGCTSSTPAKDQHRLEPPSRSHERLLRRDNYVRGAANAYVYDYLDRTTTPTTSTTSTTPWHATKRFQQSR